LNIECLSAELPAVLKDTIQPEQVSLLIIRTSEEHPRNSPD
jgi:hypothetical protein